MAQELVKGSVSYSKHTTINIYSTDNFYDTVPVRLSMQTPYPWPPLLLAGIHGAKGIIENFLLEGKF